VGYDGYFFDFDHTLFDSDASESLAFGHALAASGIERTDDLFATYASINRLLWADVEAGRYNPNQVRELRFIRLADEAMLDVDPAALAADFTVGMQEFGELYPGAREVLVALGDRGPLALVTNAISVIQRRRIERTGLDALFEVIVISSEVNVSKPSPAIFDHTFAQLTELDRNRTLMVGDSLTSDMAGGVAAGIDTCWFNQHGKANTSSLPLTHEIEDLGQLLEL
jgi:YjjG family noncanonical pyrimidine nucleotidase